MSDLVGGRYRRLALLGHGAMGDVWLAQDVTLGRHVALKTIRPPGAGSSLDHEMVERMLREARIASRLKHPNIVTVYDLLVVEGQPFVVMEYVDGQSLAERIRQRGRLEPGEAAKIVAEVAGALEVAHKSGILHRDIKPANIMIDTNGVAKLADFGIAHGAGEVSLTDTGEMLGTIAFMAPEVALTGRATTASDVWSLGATLYAAVEGHPPHAHEPGTDSAQLAVSILARRVSQPVPRPQHAGQLEVVLAAMLSDVESRPTAGHVSRQLAVLANQDAPSTTPAAEVAAAPSTGGTADVEYAGSASHALAEPIAVEPPTQLRQTASTTAAVPEAVPAAQTIRRRGLPIDVRASTAATSAPGVRWRKRIPLLTTTVLAVLGSVVAAVVFLSDRGPSANHKAGAADGPGTSSATTPGATGHASTSTPVAVTSVAETKPASASKSVLPQPGTGVVQACRIGDLTLSAITGAPSYRVGDQPVLGLQVINSGTQPCLADLDDTEVDLKVYLGTARVWSYHDCQVQPRPNKVAVSVGREARTTVTWSGLSSLPDCTGTRQRVGAGTYTLYVALSGRSGQAIQFSVN